MGPESSGGVHSVFPQPVTADDKPTREAGVHHRPDERPPVLAGRMSGACQGGEGRLRARGILPATVLHLVTSAPAANRGGRDASRLGTLRKGRQ